MHISKTLLEKSSPSNGRCVLFSTTIDNDPNRLLNIVLVVDELRRMGVLEGKEKTLSVDDLMSQEYPMQFGDNATLLAMPNRGGKGVLNLRMAEGLTPHDIAKAINQHIEYALHSEQTSSVSTLMPLKQSFVKLLEVYGVASAEVTVSGRDFIFTTNRQETQETMRALFALQDAGFPTDKDVRNFVTHVNIDNARTQWRVRIHQSAEPNLASNIIQAVASAREVAVTPPAEGSRSKELEGLSSVLRALQLSPAEGYEPRIKNGKINLAFRHINNTAAQALEDIIYQSSLTTEDGYSTNIDGDLMHVSIDIAHPLQKTEECWFDAVAKAEQFRSLQKPPQQDIARQDWRSREKTKNGRKNDQLIH